MKVKVLKPFRDRDDHITNYLPGETHEFVDDRANDLVSRGLAKAVTQKKKK